MVVVAIIGIMAAAAMPALTEMVVFNRQHGVAVDLMLLARRARAEAMFGGYANMIIYDQNANARDGGAAWATGVTSSCTQATSGFNLDAGSLDNPTGVDFPAGWQPLLPPPQGGVSLRSASFGSHRVFGRMELPAGTIRNYLTICYHPSGRTWSSSNTNNLPGWQNAAAVLFVSRTVGGVARGVDRQVVFPPSGTARLR